MIDLWTICSVGVFGFVVMFNNMYKKNGQTEKVLGLGAIITFVLLGPFTIGMLLGEIAYRAEAKEKGEK